MHDNVIVHAHANVDVMSSHMNGHADLNVHVLVHVRSGSLRVVSYRFLFSFRFGSYRFVSIRHHTQEYSPREGGGTLRREGII